MSGRKGGYERDEGAFLLAHGRPTGTFMTGGLSGLGTRRPYLQRIKRKGENQTFPPPFLREDGLRGIRLSLLQASGASYPSKAEKGQECPPGGDVCPSRVPKCASPFSGPDFISWGGTVFSFFK